MNVKTTVGMTVARLAQLEAAATPGPWHRHTYGHRSVRQAAGVVTRALFHSTHTDLSYVHGDAPDGEGPSVCLTGNGPKQTDNADLIVALRNAAPAIIDVMRAVDPALEAANAVIYAVSRHPRGGKLVDESMAFLDSTADALGAALAQLEVRDDD